MRISLLHFISLPSHAPLLPCSLYVGTMPTYHIADLDLLKEIFVKHFDKWTNRMVRVLHILYCTMCVCQIIFFVCCNMLLYGVTLAQKCANPNVVENFTPYSYSRRLHTLTCDGRVCAQDVCVMHICTVCVCLRM